MDPFSAVVSAGASIFGSIFGKKKSSNRINYKAMVRDAEAAGFNPLTALRNGGAAGYMQGGNPTTLSRVADAVGVAGDFLANFDPFTDEKREMETRLVEAQLANLQADTANKIKFGEVPTYAGGTHKRVMGSGVARGQTYKSAAAVLPDAAGASQTPSVEKPTVTNPWPTNWDLRVRPNIPDAASFEDRYGETVSDWFIGPAIAAADLLHDDNVPSPADMWGWLNGGPVLSDKKPRLKRRP